MQARQGKHCRAISTGTRRVLKRTPGMTVNHLAGDRQQTIGTTEPFVGAAQRLQSPLTGQAASTTGGHVTDSERLQVAHQAIHRRISERQPLSVQYRLRQASPDQGIADIVHVEEGIDMVMWVGGLPTAPQFDQGIRPQGAE